MHRLLAGLLCVSALVGGCGDNETFIIDPDDEPAPDGGTPPVRRHAGGSPTDIAIADGRAFIGVGPRLTIWNLAANPPALLGETMAMRGVVRAVAVAGTRAYVAETLDRQSTIHVFDVTDPADPLETAEVLVGEYQGASRVRDLVIASDRLYVADPDQGVLEIDITNPDDPRKLRVVPRTGVTQLAIVDNRLYYAAETGPGSTAVGAVTLDELVDLGSSSLGNVLGVAITEQALAVGAGRDGIFVYDVADPANAVALFHLAQEGGVPFARAVAAHGMTAWIPADDGLHVLDLSSPKAISHTGPIAMETANANATTATADTLAIVTDRGRLLSLGLAVPKDPTPRGSADVTLCASCVGATATDDTLYIADGAGGLRTATRATLESRGRSPALRNAGLAADFEDVAIAGSFAFVADWLFGLRVYDVSSPASPTLVGSISPGGAPSGVAIVGDRAYLAEGINGGLLRVLDVSDPAHPVVLGGIETSKAIAVEVRGTIAYVASEATGSAGGLRIFDVASPSAIRELGVYNDGCTSARDVALLDDIAIVACESDGFHWIDISVPSAPARIAITTPPVMNGNATAVAAWEDHVALGYDRGVLVMRVEEAPVLIGKYATAAPVRAISIPSPGQVIAACGEAGVYQW